jgi:hypothetical protein
VPRDVAICWKGDRASRADPAFAASACEAPSPNKLNEAFLLLQVYRGSHV